MKNQTKTYIASQKNRLATLNDNPPNFELPYPFPEGYNWEKEFENSMTRWQTNFKKQVRNSIVKNIETREESLSDLDDEIEKSYKNFETKLRTDNLLGVVLNLGGTHYTAITKLSKECKSWERNETGRLRSVNLMYVDSMHGILKVCKNYDDMIEFVKTLNPMSVLFVYPKRNCYESVAYSRLFSILKQRKVGGRRTLRRKQHMRNTRKMRR